MADTIPWAKLGAKATEQYAGAGLAVSTTKDGAVRLRCAFQQLAGEVTAEGLWLSSTVKQAPAERFRVLADYLGRDGGAMVALPRHGVFGGEPGQARYARRGLVEEYSVSVDGVRQDFLVAEPPLGKGALRVELAASGACVQKSASGGVQLILKQSGRKLMYGRMRVLDAAERELGAHLEVVSEERLVVIVDDRRAAYPLRIDPTFSDANWVSMGEFVGADGTVYAATADDAGNLYVGGEFGFVGAVAANRIAKWDGHIWSALGAGMDGTVSALALSGTDLYVGGYFTNAGAVSAKLVAKWNGRSWSALGSGPLIEPELSPGVSALAVIGTNLYAAVGFSKPGSNGSSYLAQWAGSAWTTLNWTMHGQVYALAVFGTTLVAAGGYTLIVPPFPTEGYVLQWDGSAWSPLGTGMDDWVTALAVSGSDLYAGGSFTNAGGTAANYVAKWTGSAWSALGSGMNGSVSALAASGNGLYAGGAFTTAGGTAATNIAKWNGSAWSALGSGMNGSVYALAVSQFDLVAGGTFTSAGGGSANHLATWDGTVWSAFASQMNDGVCAVVVSGTDLYAGGCFTTAGTVPAKLVAKWNGSSWSALGSGPLTEPELSPGVTALAMIGTNLYAAVSFSVTGSNGSGYVARWDGSGWIKIDWNKGGRIYALAVFGTNLVAAGGYTMIVPPFPTEGYVQRWDGSAWSPLGAGMDDWVTTVAVSGSDLYAGGSFTNAGGTAANYVAKWTGSAWSALGSGMNGSVSALAASGNGLYAGGAFTTAGGTAATNIAKWNGSAWSALGSGMNAGVSALAVFGTDLYAGGAFTAAGGTGANYIAKWNGSAWSALGSGMNGSVYALAVSGTDLYAGGTFTTAGNKVSAYVADAIIGTAGGRLDGLAYSPATGFGFTFSDATLGQPYRIQTCTSLWGGGWIDWVGFTYTGPIAITDPSAVVGPRKFYRAVTP